MLAYLAVACGGALGALARFITVTMVQTLFGFRFPLGTFFVNGLGAFLMGLFMSVVMERMADAEIWRLFIAVGFLGGYTTFSSFAWETCALYSDGQWPTALLNLVLTNIVTLLLLVSGLLLGR